MLGLAQQVHQQSLRIGDIVFLYSDEGKGGYVFSECSRYVAVATIQCMWILFMLMQYPSFGDIPSYFSR